MGSSVLAAVPNKLLLAGHSWGVGYRHMSRFFCKGLFELPEIVDNFDYYWRLDADSFLLKPVLKDPFKTLRDSGREYGYMVVTQEDESVVRGLWNTTSEYVNLRRLSLTKPVCVCVCYSHTHITLSLSLSLSLSLTHTHTHTGIPPQAPQQRGTMESEHVLHEFRNFFACVLALARIS
jgi:hypothetical protein